MDVKDGAPRVGWAEVATAVAPGLLRLAIMLTGSTHDAEDLLQTTFVTRPAPRSPDRRHGGPHRLPAADHGQRARLGTPPAPTAHGLADRGSRRVGPGAASGRRPDDLWSWLATLPRQQRAVLVLRYYEDLPDPEIANLVGCSPATVRSHASRGLATLRTILADQEPS